MSEKKFDLILTVLEQIQEKLDKLNAKSSEEKGSEVGSARQTDLKVKEEVVQREFKGIVGEITNETPKAYLVKREDGKVTWIAKSLLTGVSDHGKESEFRFKVDSTWAIEKLNWKEDESW